MDYRQLTELQLDALREVGNIGAGNAATALSQMIQRRIDMSVPQMDILPLEKVISKLGNEDDNVIAVVLRIFGDAPGDIVFLLNIESACRLVEMLTGQSVDPDAGFDEFQVSALQEIGNILSGAYINSIVKLTGMVFISSVPAISIDMLNSLMTTVFMEAEQFDEYVLLIEARFTEGDRNIDGHFFYIPKPGSLEKLLQALKIM